MDLHLLTLGAVRCFRDGDEIAGLPRQRLRCAVLVHLAVEGEATRERLTTMLWPERDAERARHALNQKLYELRQVLGDDWLDSGTEPIRVTPALRVDVQEFERAVERGDVESALELYDGPFLTDFHVSGSAHFDHWADRHRFRLARLHRKACRAFIDRAVERGERAAAIRAASRWTELDPLEDEAHHRLIALLAGAGDRTGAIRQYESYERLLEHEELEPLDHTRELIERVRTSTAEPGVEARSDREAAAPAREPTGLAATGGGADAVAGAAAVGSSSRSWRRIAGAAAVALLLAGAAWWTVRQSGADVATPARSIAVLPFVSFSADADADRYLSDGIAEELIHTLAQVEDLRVASRTSALRFRERDLAIRTIGDSLNVALVLEGSVRQDGDRLRVTAQLIDVANGYHLLSRTFDRRIGEALSLQEDIAVAIVDALRIRLPGSERERLSLGGTTDARAYELLLRGRYQLQQGTRTAVRNAVAHFDSALARDPEYAQGHIELARAYIRAAERADLPRIETLRRARSAAERAITLAPTLASGHAALAEAELNLWNWAAAERAARLAIQLQPNDAVARATIAEVLLAQGRTEEAVQQAARAAELEPLSAATHESYAETLRAARRFEEALRAHRRSLELNPELRRQSLAKTYIELSMHDEALAQFTAAADAGAPRFPEAELLWTAYTHARAGNLAQARALLRRFQRRQPPQSGTEYLLAATHLALGDRDRALGMLETHVGESRQRAWRQLPWDPIWDAVREDARFRSVLRRMGLATEPWDH